MFAIIVDFKGATNSNPSRMTVKSMHQVRAKTVHYPALNLVPQFDYASPRDCSKYAAQLHLDELNEKETTIKYSLGEYFQGVNNDQRIWTVKTEILD